MLFESNKLFREANSIFLSSAYTTDIQCQQSFWDADIQEEIIKE